MKKRMTTIIKHGNTVRIYKCDKCGCIFMKSERDIEELEYYLFYCPECLNLIHVKDFINNQEIDKK